MKDNKQKMINRNLQMLKEYAQRKLFKHDP